MLTMKKILSVFSAAILLLTAASCVKEDEKITVNPDKGENPVLVSANTEEDIVVEYTPAQFYYGNDAVNRKLVYHALILVSLNGKEMNVNVNAKDDVVANTLTLKANNFKTQMGASVYGLEEGQQCTAEFVVRGSVSSTLSGGTLDSEGRISYAFEFSKPQGNPWADYTEPSPWGLIGKIASTGNEWNADEAMFMVSEGNKHVAKNIKLGPADQFKVRKGGSWDINFGAPGDTEPYVLAVGESIDATAGGKNLGVSAEGNYDLLLDEEEGTITLLEAFQTYPGYDEVSNWTVIGKIASVEMEWNKDIQMITDGEWHVAEGVVLTTDDQFKFRMDQKWDTNIGATGDTEPFVVSLDEEYSGANGGKNLAVPADGVYDLLCNPATNAFKVVNSLGGKSPLVGSDDPGTDDPVVTVTGWNIIGLNGDWNNDVLASEKDGVWTAYIKAEDATDFKWRKDGAWDADYGMSKDEGYTFTMGTAFPAVAGGANIPVAAGFYKVELDLTNADAPTITVYDDFEVWSLIGDFNSWNGDVDMAITEGKWVSPVTKLNTNGFKIRKNHDWTTSYGGVFNALGEAFDATTTDGNNIMLEEEGEYIVTFDPENLKITVDPALPSDKWSLIGVNGDWNTDIFMTEMMPGIWVSPKVNITSAGWKIRFNHGWDVNRGGTLTAEGVFAKAVPGGDNIGLTGEFQVVYNANNETIGTLVWGVVGKVASINGFNWNMDVPMNLASDGKWYSLPITLAEGDEIKLRKYAAWDENYGGAFVEANTPFDAVASGDNISAVGTYMVVYDPAAATLTLSTNFWGLIGDFNSWGGDKFMLFDGANWVAYGQTIAGGWKLRQASSWDVNRGGTFTAAGTAFDVVHNGDNINVGELENFDIIYNPEAETITVQ